MRLSRHFLLLRSFHWAVYNNSPKSEECFKGFPFTLRKVFHFCKISLGSRSIYARVSWQYFRLIQVKPFAWWFIFILKWIWQNYVGLFLHNFNFPTSSKEQLDLSEKVLEEHSSNLSSFILMYCTAPGSNPPLVVAWCYLSPPSGISSCCLPLAKKTNGYCVLEPCQVFCVSTWSVLLCFI